MISSIYVLSFRYWQFSSFPVVPRLLYSEAPFMRIKNLEAPATFKKYLKSDSQIQQ
jgi:hypothetical protein